MFEDEVRAALSGFPLGGLFVYSTIDSTNNEAKRRAEAGAAHFSLVIADEQTAGRGRERRRWVTEAGTAIAISFILAGKVGGTSSELGALPGLGALAVAHLCDKLDIPTRIRWPNDVLVGEKKLAGVLAEASWSGRQLGSIVLGIGVNVTQTASTHPEFETPGTSLESELGRSVNRYETLKELVLQVQQLYQAVASPAFIAEWQSRLAYLGEEVILHEAGGRTQHGVVRGLAPDGAIRLQTGTEEILAHAGELRIRPLVTGIQESL